MYAQLCLKLNQLTPDFEESGSQTTTFRKLLLHKCQEEFERGRQATAAFDKEDGLTPEEEEQRAAAKRKMLGNIKFVGELFKLDMLHEAIIHSCIKELLERKRKQSAEETGKSIECLCQFLTTVGHRLDTEKAKGWMDKYFDRMRFLSTNKDLPLRIHFMLLDVIELRRNGWQPRRASGNPGPRTIHEIHLQAYKEMEPPPRALSAPMVGGGAGGRYPTDPMDIPPYQSQPPYRSGSSGPYFTPPVRGDEGFLSSPPSHKDSLLSPQEPIGIVSPFHPPPPRPPLGVQPAAGVGTTAERPSEKKQLRKLPSGKRDEKVSLRPAMASLKLGSSRSSPSITNPPTTASSLTPDHVTGSGQGKAGSRPSPVLRSRDDSSDEEGPPTRRGGVAKVPHPHNMGPLPPNYLHHPPGVYPAPPPHMMHPGGPGIPPYYPHGPPGMYPLPRNMPIHPHGPMMHPQPLPGHMIPAGGHMIPAGMPRGRFPPYPLPPGHNFGLPFHHGVAPALPPHSSYGPPGRPPSHFGPPQWPLPTGAPPPSGPAHLNQPPRPEGMNRPLPPGLERNEPLIPVVRKPTSKPKKGSQRKADGGTGRPENEAMMEPIIDQLLQTLDIASAVSAITRLKGITKEAICLLLITMSLEKSEDDRTHISDLMQELHSKEVITGEHFLQAFTTIMSSIDDYEKDLPQCKPYIAGFVARAISKGVGRFADVVPTFRGGAHHPMVLVVLQALVPLIGEDGVFQAFQESQVTLSSILPVNLRSHDQISELMEAKNLGFLYPLRRIQMELSAELKQDASAVAVYKWIKNNVDQSFYSTREFVAILTRCILDRVTRGSTLAVDVQRTETPPKGVIKREQELMEKFKVLVQKFVNESVDLQISTLYATQVFCHDHQFPKGLLLRLFSYWYDLDVVEEEAFLQWKEDISQEHPGKGQALFQVNQWLVLLAEAENEEDSEDD